MMKRPFVSMMAVVVAVSLVISGCTQAAPAPTPTKAPAAPTKGAEPTKAPAAAPTKAAEPTKAPAAPPTTAPAKKIDWPQKGRTVQTIVSFTAGGSTDVGARVLAPFLEKELGVSVEVVNKPGAGGQIGATELSQARPDGYTLGYTSIPTVVTLILDASRKAVFTKKSFVPIASTLTDPIIMGVQSGSPYKTAKDVLDDAKARPEQVKASTAGILGAIHLGAVVTEKVAGVKFGIVVFDGGGPAVTALLGGHVDVAFNTGQEQVPHVKSGAVRTLAILDKQGTKFLPGVKTFEEQGYKIFMSSTHGLSAPAGTPKEITDILESAIKRAMDNPEYKQKMENAGLEPRFLSSAQFSAAWDQMEIDLKPIVEAATKK